VRGGDRNIPSPRWESNPDRPTRRLVAILTELCIKLVKWIFDRTIKKS
jgi:hypothetical protein